MRLDRNQITEIPDSIGNLSKLKKLFLYINQISELPESIGQLSNLKELLLHTNQINELPESIKKIQCYCCDIHVVFQPTTDGTDIVIFRNVSKTFVESIEDILGTKYETEIVLNHTRQRGDEHIQFVNETVAKVALDMFGGEWSVPREELIIADEAREMRDKYITENLWVDDLKVINKAITDAATKGRTRISMKDDVLKCCPDFVIRQLQGAGYSTVYEIHIMW